MRRKARSTFRGKYKGNSRGNLKDTWKEFKRNPKARGAEECDLAHALMTFIK